MVDEFMAAVFSRWPGVVVQVSHPPCSLSSVSTYTLIVTTPHSLKSHLLTACMLFLLLMMLTCTCGCC